MKSRARDPKRKVALKIENKRRFSGQESTSQHALLAAKSRASLPDVFFPPGGAWALEEDEDDAKKQSRSIPLRSYEAEWVTPAWLECGPMAGRNVVVSR